MTDRNPEVPVPDESGAEIRARLERISQKLDAENDASKRMLARKMRETLRTPVGAETRESIAALRSGLNDQEKRLLSASITDSDLRSTVESIATPETSSRTAEAATGTVAVAAGAVAANLNRLDSMGERVWMGNLGIVDSIKEWVSESLNEEPPTDFLDKIFHKIKMLFLGPLAKVFGIEIPQRAAGAGGNRPENPTARTTPNERREWEMELRTAIKGVYLLSVSSVDPEMAKRYRGDMGNMEAALYNRAISDKDWNSLKATYSRFVTDPSWLAQALGMGNFSDSDVFLALNGLFRSEKILEKHMPEGSEWRTKPLREIAQLAAAELSGMVKMNTQGFWLDFQKMDFSFINVVSDGDSGIKMGGVLEAKAEKMKGKSEYEGMTTNVLSMLAITTYANNSSEDVRFDARQHTEKEAAFFRTFMEFSGEMNSYLRGHSPFGLDIQRAFGRPLKASEMLPIFILTGGEKDPSKWNDTTKVYMKYKIFDLLLQSDATLAAQYMDRFATAWMNGTHLGEEEKRLFSVAIGATSESALRAATFGMEFTYGLIKENPMLTATVGVGFVALLILFSRFAFFRWGFAGGAAAATVAAFVGSYLAMTPKDGAGKIDVNGQKYTESEAREIMEREINAKFRGAA